MASSFEEQQLVALARAATAVGLDYVVIGNASAALQGAPIMTQDIDLFVRDTKRNQEKIAQLAVQLRGTCDQPFLPTSNMFRIRTADAIVDCVLRLSSGQRFESVRSRAVEIELGSHKLRVAALADVIAQKEAAGRDKDRAVLPILRATLKARAKLR